MKTLPYIVWNTDMVEEQTDSVMLLGGKAMGLHRLRNLGVDVPVWATVTSLFFRHLCSRDAGLQALLCDEEPEISAKAAALHEHIGALSIPEEGMDVLRSVWDTVSEQGRVPIAVRSSAADEDSMHLSFAGQMDSFLNVLSFAQFIEALRRCWASLFNERAVFYRQKSGLDCWSLQIAVVAQQMVEPDVSGVIFTANPLNGNRNEMLVCSTWGLGEGLVAGTLPADTYVLGAGGVCLRQTLAEKQQRVACHATGGTETVDLADDRHFQATLDDVWLQKLYRLATRVQTTAGRPMDIEFAVCKDTVYLLQARPVTALEDAAAEPSRDNPRIWDNANIVESYSGITTPLTFSFIRKAYFAVYWQFCRIMGVSSRTAFRNRHIFANMLGFIQGRVYYNLLNWYRLIGLLPGYKYNKSFMEQMMGLQVISSFSPEEESRNLVKKYLVHFPKMLWTGFRMLLNHFTLSRKIRAFHASFDHLYSRHASQNFQELSVFSLMEIYRELENKVLWNWKAPILNDFEAMVFFGLLQKLTAAWILDANGSLYNDLLCGEGGIKSTEVTDGLIQLAATIEADKELKATFLENPPSEILRRLQSDPSLSGFARLFGDYLENYGVRSIDEMKLESIPVKDDPTFCIAVLQNYLRCGIPDSGKRKERDRHIRQQAEEAVRTRLQGKKCFRMVPQHIVYRWVLKNARAAVRNRENQRFARSQAYDVTRRIFRAIGQKWQMAGILDDREDIFYLDVEEIWSYIEGASTCPDLRQLANLRRKIFASYATATPDDHIETYGEVYRGGDYAGGQHEVDNAEQLQGLGCCRGVVENTVRIIRKPDADTRLDGEIMVAQQTDPGWIVLFPSISGLIVEKGSLLSHSAIVAREMGIPAIVGVKNATRLLRDGDRVRLDGSTGTITLMRQTGP